MHTIWNYIFQKILISKGEIAACDQEVAKIVSEIDDGSSIGDFVSILQASRHIQPSWIVIVETNLHFACYRLFRLTESIDKKIETCNFIG